MIIACILLSVLEFDALLSAIMENHKIKLRSKYQSQFIFLFKPKQLLKYQQHKKCQYNRDFRSITEAV